MSGLLLFFDFRGKIGRLPYSASILTLAILFFLIFIVSDFQTILLDHGLGAARLVPLVLLAWSALALFMKRVRDSNRPMLAMMIGVLIPGIGGLLLIAAAFFPSQKADDKA